LRERRVDLVTSDATEALDRVQRAALAAPSTIVALLASAKALASEYYELTGRPLGVTGEIAEYEAASKLGLELCGVRTAGYDATRLDANGNEQRIQIKGRRVEGRGRSANGRVGNINLLQPFDTVLLVLLDARFNPIEMLETTRELVTARLTAPGSVARNERGSLGISQFRSIATRVWPPASESD
jgi:hypothetical protein